MPIGVAGNYLVTAVYRRADGSERVENLGTHEATMGRKAKAKAINLINPSDMNQIRQQASQATVGGR
jgi:hypothetical protein